MEAQSTGIVHERQTDSAGRFCRPVSSGLRALATGTTKHHGQAGMAEGRHETFHAILRAKRLRCQSPDRAGGEREPSKIAGILENEICPAYIQDNGCVPGQVRIRRQQVIRPAMSGWSSSSSVSGWAGLAVRKSSARYLARRDEASSLAARGPNGGPAFRLPAFRARGRDWPAGRS
jgi:hypothetical protein